MRIIYKFLILLLLLGFFLFLNNLFQIIPIFQYQNNAIILIIGDYGSFNDSRYDDDFLSEKYKEYWEVRAEELKNFTNWKVYLCYEKIFNFHKLF